MDSNTDSPDAAGHFGSPADIVDYINLWMQDGSPREIARAVGDVARSQGLTEIFSPKTGFGPLPLHPALSHDGNPTLEMFTAVLDALGLALSVR